MNDSDTLKIEWLAPRTVRVMLNLAILLTLIFASSALLAWLLLGHLFQLEPGIKSELLALLVTLALSHLAIGLLFDNFIEWYTGRCSFLDDCNAEDDKEFIIYTIWVGFSYFLFLVIVSLYSRFDPIYIELRFTGLPILIYGNHLRIPLLNYLKEQQAKT